MAIATAPRDRHVVLDHVRRCDTALSVATYPIDRSNVRVQSGITRLSAIRPVTAFVVQDLLGGRPRRKRGRHPDREDHGDDGQDVHRADVLERQSLPESRPGRAPRNVRASCRGARVGRGGGRVLVGGHFSPSSVPSIAWCSAASVTSAAQFAHDRPRRGGPGCGCTWRVGRRRRSTTTGSRRALCPPARRSARRARYGLAMSTPAVGSHSSSTDGF